MNHDAAPGDRVLDADGALGLGVVRSAPDGTLVVRHFCGLATEDHAFDGRRYVQLPDNIVVDAVEEDTGRTACADVTWAVLDLSAEKVQELRDGGAPAATLAARFVALDGPLHVTAERAVCSYLGVEDLSQVTPERMEQARAVLREIGPWHEPDGQPIGWPEAEELLDCAEEICSTEQDNDAETWYVTVAGQIVRVCGLEQDRVYVVPREEAKDMLMGMVEDDQLRMLFGDEAAEALFDEALPGWRRQGS